MSYRESKCVSRKRNVCKIVEEINENEVAGVRED